jgi:two-component system chemotaxis sensor kinase CheA
VECGPLTIGFPVNAIKHTIELRNGAIAMDGGESSFSFDGRRIPLMSLNRLLGQPAAPGARDLIPTVVMEVGGMTAGLDVDRLLGQREIFVKPLGIPLNRIKGLTGGSIMGDGRIVYVMDAGALL